MARPADRMRLKDKIIDNISKGIKSIQEHVYYRSKDPVAQLGGASPEAITVSNGDRACHRLCENLDHALLHGLRQVTHGYWRVVKQLSHKALIREIELLTNVTTDLGRGRAWLYASLNECLLESYIRLLGNNDKLLKKYYAKDALVLDSDRMNVLLTLTSGLDYVTFCLEYDMPYLDLSASPPRTRTGSELEEDVGSLPALSTSVGSCSEVMASSPDSTTRLPSDSDSASVSSFDVLSQNDPNYAMRISVVSQDSGFNGDSLMNSMISSGPRQRSVTPTENSNLSTGKMKSGIQSDNMSVSSLGSAGGSGDTDRHRRLENIMPQSGKGEEEDLGTDSLEVIRISSKRNSKLKKKKLQAKRGSETESKEKDTNIGLLEPLNKQSNLDGRNKVKVFGILKGERRVDSFEENSEIQFNRNNMDIENPGNNVMDDGTDTVFDSLTTVDHHSDPVDLASVKQISQFDSGVDICGLAQPEKQNSLSQIQLSSAGFVSNDKDEGQQSEGGEFSSSSSGSGKPASALAEIQSKIAAMCLTEDKVISAVHTASSCASPTTGASGMKLYKNEKSQEGEFSKSSETYDSERDPKGSSGSLQTSHSSFTHPYNETSGFNDVKMKSDYHQESERNIRDSDKKGKGSREPSSEREDYFDVYASYNETGHDQRSSSDGEHKLTKVQAASQLQDYMDFILKGPDSASVKAEAESPLQVAAKQELALNLDNNTKLQLMLDILIHEDENFIKMYVTRENHTEGDMGVVYVLISDQCLYLLNYDQNSRKFILQSSARLTDLIFISTGLYEQTINIESRGKSRQKQRLWLTPGHQALTKEMLACLTDAVKAANEYIVSVRSRFSVGSDVPLQKIALRKYISKEINCEPQDVEIEDYSLVFWEDPSSSRGAATDAAFKEGTILLRTQDPFKGHVWKPVYVVLKNGMLCVYNNKTENQPHSSLGLGGSQCVGCRLTSLDEREHCVELVLAQGISWFLSAASHEEVSEWRHALCLAVSQGSEENNTVSACVPCCAVLACARLFMCHEDLQTKFVRTLGRAQVEDITGIAVDSGHTYCIVEFDSQEAGVSSVQWVFYFSSSGDMDRHIVALRAEWKNIFKVDLPMTSVDNIALQRNCQMHSTLLQQSLSFR